MRAAVMYGAGDVRVEDRPDPKIHEPTDAVVRVLRAAICGSDLWPYAAMPATDQGRPMGHEFLGVIEEAGSQVPGLSAGDLVITPFTWCDNTCDFCRKGLQTSCRHGGRYGFTGVDGGQGEAVRVPQAQGTLVKLPVAADSALLPSLLTLSDVLCTGHHGAVKAGVSRGDTVTVIGDGAVGLFAVLAAHRLGAGQIILMGGHTDRTSLGRDFGATDIVAERGDKGVAVIKELTGGLGAHSVVEAVGTQESMMQAIRSTRPGGHVGYVGVAHGVELPGQELFYAEVHMLGGPAPVRRFLPELIGLIWNRQIDPGRVFDLELPLDQAAEGYQAMDERRAIKTLLRP